MILSNSKLVENKTAPDVIGIAVLHSFHRDVINKPENKLTIKEISNKITKLDFKVEAITGDDAGVVLKKVLPEETNTPPTEIEDKTEASQGSLLADAVSLMGGKVVSDN